MSLECGECERDLRGGHDESCSRHPDNRRKVAATCPGQPMGEECRQCGMIYCWAPSCPPRRMAGTLG